MDLLNDALLSVAGRVDRFRCDREGSPMVQLAKWTHAAVYNVFVDENRRRNSGETEEGAPGPGVPPVFMEDLPPDTPEFLYDPLQETDDLRRDLRTAFLSIPDPEVRLVADMLLVQGMTVREVAAVIDRPRSTVQDWLSEAVAHLRIILKPYRP